MAPPTSWNCQIFVFKTTPSEKNYQNRLVPLPKEQLRISKAKFVTGINLPKLRCENIFPTLTHRLSGFEILNNATLIFQKWLVSRHFGNVFRYLNFSEEYL